MIKLFLKRFFYYVDVTSLDVFLGTLGMLFFIEYSFQADTVPFDYQLSIAVVIWLSYLTDHIIDANLLKQKLLPRHSFFINNKAAIYWCVFFIFLTIPLLIFHLEMKFLIQYGVLAMVFIFCRWIFRKHSWTHSIIIALGYSIGIFSPYIYYNKFSFIDQSSILVFLMVFLLSVANIVTINFIECEEDRLEKQRTIFSEGNTTYKYLVIAVYLFSIQTIIVFLFWEVTGVYLLCATVFVFGCGYLKSYNNKYFLKTLIELSLSFPIMCIGLNKLFMCVENAIAN